MNKYFFYFLFLSFVVLQNLIASEAAELVLSNTENAENKVVVVPDKVATDMKAHDKERAKIDIALEMIRKRNFPKFKKTFSELKTNSMDIVGTTLLTIAIRHNAREIINLILEREDCDVSVSGFMGRDALCEAARYGNPELIETLIKRGAEPCEYAAINAAYSGNLDNLKKLYEYHVSVPSDFLLKDDRVLKPEIIHFIFNNPGQNQFNDFEKFCIYARLGDTDNVKKLVNTVRANKDFNFNSALFYAVYSNSVDMIKLCLELGMKVEEGDGEKNALWLAIYLNHPKVVEILINSLNIVQKKYYLPHAIHCDHTEIVELLINRGFDLSAGGCCIPFLNTSLFYAEKMFLTKDMSDDSLLMDFLSATNIDMFLDDKCESLTETEIEDFFIRLIKAIFNRPDSMKLWKKIESSLHDNLKFKCKIYCTVLKLAILFNWQNDEVSKLIDSCNAINLRGRGNIELNKEILEMQKHHFLDAIAFALLKKNLNCFWMMISKIPADLIYKDLTIGLVSDIIKDKSIVYKVYIFFYAAAKQQEFEDVHITYLQELGNIISESEFKKFNDEVRSYKDKNPEMFRNHALAIRDFSGSQINSNTHDFVKEKIFSENKQTYLNWLAMLGFKEQLKELLAEELPCWYINSQDIWGKTALMYAIQFGYTEMAGLLIEYCRKQPDIKYIRGLLLKDDEGYSALNYAIYNNSLQIIDKIFDSLPIDQYRFLELDKVLIFAAKNSYEMAGYITAKLYSIRKSQGMEDKQI